MKPMKRIAMWASVIAALALAGCGSTPAPWPDDAEARAADRRAACHAHALLKTQDYQKSAAEWGTKEPMSFGLLYASQFKKCEADITRWMEAMQP